MNGFVVKDLGVNNAFVCGDLSNSVKNIAEFYGNNNKVVVEDGVECRHLRIVMRGDNNFVKFQANSKVKGTIAANNRSTIHIGRRTTIGSGFDVVTDGCIVKIGHDCMIAKDVILRASDGHPVFDISTGERVNMSQNIEIDNYVWIAKNVSILKGNHIGVGCIVGSGSIVTKSIPMFCAAAGNPAKIIKEGVTWSRSVKVENIYKDKRGSSYINKHK